VSPRTETRERVVRAALRTLAEDGFAATSARAIARRGGFAPGVIYYHFDDLEHLLLAALEWTSELRLARYRDELAGVTSAAELLARLRALYAEDVADGHVAAVQELVAGAASSPRLGPAIVERLRPWLELTEEMARRFLAGTPLEHVVPAPEVGLAVVALYLGLETLTHLDRDRNRVVAESLFAAAGPAAALFDSLLGQAHEGGAQG
jgi:AcrR family transcriptional regulator